MVRRSGPSGQTLDDSTLRWYLRDRSFDGKFFICKSNKNKANCGLHRAEGGPGQLLDTVPESLCCLVITCGDILGGCVWCCKMT